ncbi:unnamed protein product [Urochloa humidicola]
MAHPKVSSGRGAVQGHAVAGRAAWRRHGQAAVASVATEGTGGGAQLRAPDGVHGSWNFFRGQINFLYDGLKVIVTKSMTAPR